MAVLLDPIVDVGNALGTDIVHSVEMFDDRKGREVHPVNLNFQVAKKPFVDLQVDLN